MVLGLQTKQNYAIYTQLDRLLLYYTAAIVAETPLKTITAGSTDARSCRVGFEAEVSRNDIADDPGLLLTCSPIRQRQTQLLQPNGFVKTAFYNQRLPNADAGHTPLLPCQPGRRPNQRIMMMMRGPACWSRDDAWSCMGTQGSQNHVKFTSCNTSG
jgi:hypothetical protein